MDNGPGKFNENQKADSQDMRNYARTSGERSRGVGSVSEPLQWELDTTQMSCRSTHHAYGKRSKACKTEKPKDNSVTVEQGIDTESENCCEGKSDGMVVQECEQLVTWTECMKSIKLHVIMA